MATDNTERIDKFLRDQMTPEEIDAFLRDMELDEELRKEAQLTALMIQDLQERQAERDSEIIEEVVASKKKAKIVRMVRWTVEKGENCQNGKMDGFNCRYFLVIIWCIYLSV